jgi:hypothetical protein
MHHAMKMYEGVKVQPYALTSTVGGGKWPDTLKMLYIQTEMVNELLLSNGKLNMVSL